MGLELKEPTLVSQLEQLADETTQPAEQVLEAAVSNYLDELERRAISRRHRGVFGRCTTIC